MMFSLKGSVENIRIEMGGCVFPVREFLLFPVSVRNSVDMLGQFLLLPWLPLQEKQRSSQTFFFPLTGCHLGKQCHISLLWILILPELQHPCSSLHLWQVEEGELQPPLDDLPAFLCKEAIMEAYPWGTKCLFPLQFHDAFLCSLFSTAWPDLWFFFCHLVYFSSCFVLF